MSSLVVTPYVNVDCIDAATALKKFCAEVKPSEVRGFIYTPSAAPWFLAKNGVAVGPEENLNLDSAFELRAFTSEKELRWWRCDPGTTKAVVLSESNDNDGLMRHGDLQELLLWGKATGDSGVWVTLREGRIGSLKVPVGPGIQPNKRVAMQIAEYTSKDDFGNVGVVEHRIVGLKYSNEGAVK